MISFICYNSNDIFGLYFFPFPVNDKFNQLVTDQLDSMF